MSTRLHIVVSEELLARVDAARGPGQPRSDWIRRVVERALAKADGSLRVRAERDVAERYGLEPSAVEQALSEAKGPDSNEQADPAVRTPGEGRSAAPAEQPEHPNLRGAYEVAAKGGLVGGLFQRAADRVAAEQPRRAGPDVAAFRRATQK